MDMHNDFGWTYVSFFELIHTPSIPKRVSLGVHVGKTFLSLTRFVVNISSICIFEVY